MSLRRGLAKSRGEEGFFGKLRALFSGDKEIGTEIAEDIEEVLLASDVGVQTTETILSRLRESLAKGDRMDSSKVWEALREEAREILDVDGKAGAFPLTARPTVVLMVGVNGAGKTTTIGKLATKLEAEGHKCVLAAGDTFRAAAVQQLIVWGERVGCEVVRGKDGADPGSVVFDAIKKAEEIGADVVLADTAGRLHTKTNLMTEMTKIAKTAGKAMEGAPHEILARHRCDQWPERHGASKGIQRGAAAHGLGAHQAGRDGQGGSGARYQRHPRAPRAFHWAGRTPRRLARLFCRASSSRHFWARKARRALRESAVLAEGRILVVDRKKVRVI